MLCSSYYCLAYQRKVHAVLGDAQRLRRRGDRVLVLVPQRLELLHDVVHVVHLRRRGRACTGPSERKPEGAKGGRE